jgi:hypothetical protein
MADVAVAGGDSLFAPVASAELPEIKLFGKWSTDDVQVSDISLTVSFFEVHEPHKAQPKLSLLFFDSFSPV